MLAHALLNLCTLVRRLFQDAPDRQEQRRGSIQCRIQARFAHSRARQEGRNGDGVPQSLHD
jgi:hypothetical protein